MRSPSPAAPRSSTLDSGLQVCFCDPRSPWQRGSNENTNGLLRQYFPKRTKISMSQDELDEIAPSSTRARARRSAG